MCAYTCVHSIVLILSSQPTQLLWWSLHALCMILWGRNWGWGFLQVTKTPGTVVAKLPGSQTELPLHRCTQGINHYYHHLTKRGLHMQEVSCIANGCSKHYDSTCTRHVFPATSVGSWTHTANSWVPHPILDDITAPCELDWQAVCLFSSVRRSPFPVLPLF